jgi:uncharacterized protein (DUF58 family)
MTLSVERAIDWGTLGPLAVKTRLLAEGVFSGRHRSTKRGGGIEFDGFREYAAGDDVRRLDKRALLQRDKLLVRQFETETERSVRIVVDATASMQYCGKRAHGAKYAYAALLAGALARVAVQGGDPIALDYVGGHTHTLSRVRTAGGFEAYRRAVASLESTLPSGDLPSTPALLYSVFDELSRMARRGAVLVVFTDALDLPKDGARRIADLAGTARTVLLVQVLDPDEHDFPFEGAFRFTAHEGAVEVESDQEAREGYLAKLAAYQTELRSVLVSRGARFLSIRTDEDPTNVLRRIVETLAQG